MGILRTKKLNLFIPVEIEGEDKCPGIRKGGVMTMVRPDVELLVTAGDIPDSIVGSIEGMDIGDTLTISDIKLPAGAKPTIDRDFVIANIQAPSGLRSSESEGSDDAPEADEVPATEQAEE